MEKPKYSHNYIHSCKVCGKAYYPFRKSQEYCSRICAAKGRSGKTKRSTTNKYNVQCAFCGAGLYRKPYLLKINSVFFCNRKCQAEYYRDAFKGENNPHFTNSKRDYSLGIKIRTQRNGKKWRKGVLERDKSTCQLCGKTADQIRIEADHIYPLWRIIKELGVTSIEEANNLDDLWNIENGRALCVECHRKVKAEGEFRMAGKTNTQRTLEYLKELGWSCDIAERWIRNPKHPAGGFRKDLFGCIDIVALGENSIIAVQSCGQAFSEHNKKITQDERVAPNALKWVQCGGRLILIGWRKVKLKRGGKAKRWSPRIKEYTEVDFLDE